MGPQLCRISCRSARSSKRKSCDPCIFQTECFEDGRPVEKLWRLSGLRLLCRQALVWSLDMSSSASGRFCHRPRVPCACVELYTNWNLQQCRLFEVPQPSSSVYCVPLLLQAVSETVIIKTTWVASSTSYTFLVSLDNDPTVSDRQRESTILPL